MRRFLSVTLAASTALTFSSSRAFAGELQIPTGRSVIPLSAPLSQLQAEAGAVEQLQLFVKRGGVLRVSSDAATLFGFSVIKPRERTFNRAGQRFGRAQAAIPPDASPLLWNTQNQSSRARTDGLPGVREVFYELPSPDDLLLSEVGKAGVPLLQVEEPGKPLYAAAMRRYGRGWVVFAPRRIEERADGAAFEQNIEDFCQSAAHGDWHLLPSAALVETLSWNKRLALLPEVDEKPDAEEASDQPALPLSSGELEAIRQVWEAAAGAPQKEGVQKRARALNQLLRLRLSWLQAPVVPKETPAKRETQPVAQGAVASDTLQNIFSEPRWREAFWKEQQGGDYAPFARWWNGVLALQNCDVRPTEGINPQIRAVSMADDAAEAQDWWEDATPTLADGTQSSEAAEDAIECARDVEDIHRSDPLLQATWTPQGGAPCSMLLSPMHAVSNQFPPDSREWGTPTKTFRIYIFLLDNMNSDAMSLGVQQPIEYLPSNAIRAQMLWRCSAWWSTRLPVDYGFDPVPLRFVITPKHSYGEYGESWYGLSGESVRSPHLDSTHFDFSYPATEEARLQDEWICLPTIFNPPVPTPEALRKIRGITSWADTSPGMNFFRYYMETVWRFQEQDLTLTPARVARMSATLCEEHWLDGSGVSASGLFDDGLQNLFSIETGDFLEQNEDTPENVLLSPPSQLPNIANANPRQDVFDEMERAARCTSLARSDLSISPIRPARAQPSNILEDQDSTKIMRYFYTQFGAGSVVETLQRLGAGEPVDEALEATTGLTQTELRANALKK